ncbi:hypothetical protein C8J56DRAFT_891790 [Mycena floridula]|nr:hypothetical protein C8J56DRAFT_891790 [Mycena floridula]
MPHQPLPQGSSKVEQIAQSGRNSARILKDIADTTKSSYLQGLAGIASMIFETIENVKSNKEQCLIMTEQAYELICAVINCCEDAIKLAPAFLHSILILTSTFQKVVSFMRDHTGGSLLKRLLHHPQAAILMENCISSLEHALTLFKVQSNIMTAARMSEMQTIATKRHQELLDIINQPSELDMLHELRQSASSVSVLLPAAPKIFHGRQNELEHIINVLTQNETAQVAILGPGGIGKTSLAHATLHHPQIMEKFGPCCYWIACDSSESANDLIAVISTYFGINGQNRLHAILTCIREMARPVILILDNLETPWEQRGKQREVEDMLSHLTGLDNLSVMVTMRGSERPAQVQWTRPFLPPLGPISAEAARQTFLDISDADEEDPRVGELLSFTDNMPLVVSLFASIAGSEGCATTLTRWMSETTSLLSDGFNKQSNLEKSIEISLHSARFKSVPNAQHLLSILSYLPDGITLVEFKQISFTFSDFSHSDDRLKLLAPVKEYIQKTYPPHAASIISIRTYFFDMIKLAAEIYKTPALLHKFTSNIGNIQLTLRMALINPDLATIRPVLNLLFGLSHLYYVANIGSFDLIQSCFKIIEALPDNSQLLGHYYMTIYWTIPHHEAQHAEAMQMMELILMSIEKAYEIQDSSCIAWGFYRLAVAQIELDQPKGALKSLEISQMEAHTLGDIFLEFASIAGQIEAHIDLGNFTYAAHLIDEAAVLIHCLNLSQTDTETIYQEIINMPSPQNNKEQSLIHRAWASYYFHRVKDFAQVKYHCSRCLLLDPNTLYTRDICMQFLGDVEMIQNSPTVAERHYIVVLALSALTSRAVRILDALCRLGNVYWIRDKDELTVFSLFEMMLEAYTVRDIHMSRGHCMVRLAEILEIRGEADQAKAYLEQAVPLFEISLQWDQVQLCHDRIVLLDNSALSL